MTNYNTTYQQSKTLRFGLTFTKKSRKNERHSLLKDCLFLSEKQIINELKNNATKQFDELPLTEIRTCFEEMKEYTKAWNEVFMRTDQLAVSKDFYKILCKKARFDGFWLDKKRFKQPQSQIIKLSSLNSKYEEKLRKSYIIDYWAENIRKIKIQADNFESILIQFEKAKEDNRTDKKLNQVDFRKIFLPLTKLIQETLLPLSNGSICFPELAKLSDKERDQKIQLFVLQDKSELLAKIELLKLYFEENGGYVPYGRATLNKYTALQKPNKFYQEIDNALKIIKLHELLKKMNDKEDVNTYFEEIIDKKTHIANKNMSLVERVQMFKYKPIPASVQFMLIDYLSEKHNADRNKLKVIFQQIGLPRSPAKDYSDIQNKEDFDLTKYPIKVAFDFAWEALARLKYHPTTDLPETKCKKYLKNKFAVDTESKEFKLYADLLELRSILSTLEHGKPTDRAKFVSDALKILNNPHFPKVLIDRYNKNSIAALAIITWIKMSEEEQDKLRKNNDNKFKNYDKAKNKIGLERGRQKNKVEAYDQLTESFKKLSMDYGKIFATLREALNEESELNKITHYGVIVEDLNSDRYLLLNKLDETRKGVETLFNNEHEGELKTYRVKSLTSKTLKKLLMNDGGFKTFHTNNKPKDWKNSKKEWAEYKDSKVCIEYVKDCLINSEMAKEQHWNEFDLDLTNCDTYERIEKVLDAKGYILKDDRKISISTVNKLVESGNCILLPIVNQDIASDTRQLKNRFSKDWDLIFNPKSNFRLHPEFRMSYRMPTPDYPKPEEKRYSRFQMIGHLLCEIVPQSTTYISKKEQLKVFNDVELQKNSVDAFTYRIKKEIGNNYYIFGIDRGLKQLATLCILDQNGVIQGDFEIYTRTFNTISKQWEHTFSERRNILDISNLRVETTIDSKKVLVDLSLIKVKDKEGNYTKDNLQKIKLKQLAYIRKLQFQMQTNPESVLKFFKENPTLELVSNNIGELITPYKEGTQYSNLPSDEILEMLHKFSVLSEKNDEKGIRELVELDAADNLKSGIVANMVGVIAHLIEKYNYKVFVSLENLTRAFNIQRDGLDDDELSRKEDFMDQENKALAGLGTYHYFEAQLLRKLHRMQNKDKIVHLVPAFRSNDNYETIRKLSTKTGEAQYTCKPFGAVQFVDPKFTSKRCPACEKTNVSRQRKEDAIVCKNAECSYKTTDLKVQKDAVLKSKNKSNKNLHFICNGDENGAYHIAWKTWENLKKEM